MGKQQLGLIGLGRTWESAQKPALVRLGSEVEVTAIYDQVARRAEIEANFLRCRVVHGLVALLADPEVGAVVWLAPQWFGTHPVALARRASKPIYCALPLPEPEAELNQLALSLTSDSHQSPARIFWPAGDFALDAFLRLAREADPNAAAWTTARANLAAAIAERRGIAP